MRMFDLFGKRAGRMPEPHPCERCGQPTIFLVCDPCFRQEVAEAKAAALQPTQSTQPTQPTQPTADQRLDDLGWLVDIKEIGGPLDGDEFQRTLEAVRAGRSSLPPTRMWWGLCPWCARELRERSGDDETHRPQWAQIRTCPRHRKALLALSAWLRQEKFGGENGGDAA